MKRSSLNIVLLLFFQLAITVFSSAQVVLSEDDSATADPSAVLDIQSLVKGVLLPRMTSTQRELISNPAEGLIVYDTNTKSFHYYTSDGWLELAFNAPTEGRSIFVTPTSLDGSSFSGSASRGTAGSHRTANMPNGSTSNLVFTLPIPADYHSGLNTAKIIYTSTSNSGNIGVTFQSKAFGVGDVISQAPAGTEETLPPPASIRHLQVGTVAIGDGANPDLDDLFLLCIFRRNGASALDTSTGTFQLIGMILDYQAIE